MRKLVAIGAGFWGLVATGTALAQSAPPKTCSEAYSACATQTQLPKECETEKQWCVKTGTFAHPKTKAVTLNLQKR